MTVGFWISVSLMIWLFLSFIFIDIGKKKTRIVERTNPDGRVKYVIQQKHFLFKWWWVDAWLNSGSPWTTDDFDTKEEAEANLCYFNGSHSKDKVV